MLRRPVRSHGHPGKERMVERRSHHVNIRPPMLNWVGFDARPWAAREDRVTAVGPGCLMGTGERMGKTKMENIRPSGGKRSSKA